MFWLFVLQTYLHFLHFFSWLIDTILWISLAYIYNQMFSCYGRHCCCLLNFVFINFISPFCFPPCRSSGLAAGLCSETIHQGNCMHILLKYHSHIYLYCCIISLPLACVQYALFISIPCFIEFVVIVQSVMANTVRSMMMFITHIR